MDDSIRLQRLKTLESDLASLVQDHTPAFHNAVRDQLSKEEQCIFDLGMPLYGKGRWWDPWGIPDSIFDAEYILNHTPYDMALSGPIDDRQRLLTFAVLIYHDTGYPPASDSAAYAGKDMRDLHMRVGAANFLRDLGELRTTGGAYMFTRAEIAEGFNSVIKHDDKYLGPVENNPSLHRFMDADNIFVPSFVSAYKDFVSRYARPTTDKNGKDMTGEEFLRMRMSYFFDKDNVVEGTKRVAITQESDERYREKKLYTYSPVTKEIFAAHMRARVSELEQGAFDYAYQGDWEGFKRFAIDYLEGSIEMAKSRKSLDFSRYD